MDPTTIGYTATAIQPFSSIFGLGFHWIWTVGGLLGIVGIQLFIWGRTGSFKLGQIVSVPFILGLGFMGFAPWWMVITLMVMLVGWAVFAARGSLSDEVIKEDKKDTVQDLTKAQTGIETVISTLPNRTMAILLRSIENDGKGREDMTNQLIQKSPEELAIQRSKFKERTLPEDFRPSDTWPSGLPKSRPVTVQTLSLEDKVSSLLKDSNFDKGQRVFTSLKAEHDGIVQLFSGSKVNDTLINVEKTKSAVEDVYSKGLTFIEQATLVSKQIGTTDVNTLQRETDELTEQLKNHPVESTVGKTLKQVIDKNANILSLVKKNKDSIDELLCQVSLCKDSIEEIRLTLPSLINYTSADDLQKPIAELQQRVDFAQKLHDEFKAQGL